MNSNNSYCSRYPHAQVPESLEQITDCLYRLSNREKWTMCLLGDMSAIKSTIKLLNDLSDSNSPLSRVDWLKALLIEEYNDARIDLMAFAKEILCDNVGQIIPVETDEILEQAFRLGLLNFDNLEKRIAKDIAKKTRHRLNEEKVFNRDIDYFTEEKFTSEESIVPSHVGLERDDIPVYV